MKAINIVLPDSLDAYIERQISTGEYTDASEYLESLVQADARNRAAAELEASLLKGIDSGESDEMTRDEWLDIRRQVRENLGKGNGR
jgi:antitoxin ParD1/3/4